MNVSDIAAEGKPFVVKITLRSSDSFNAVTHTLSSHVKHFQAE